MKIGLSVVVVFTSLLLNAQDLNWQWGELQRNKGQLLSIMMGQNNSFSTLHSSSQLGSANYQLTQFEQFSPFNSVRIKPISQEGFGYYVNTLRRGQQHWVFIADRNSKEMKLFVKILDSENNLIEERALMSYTDQRPNALPEFTILEAPNKAYFGVFYQIPGKRNGSDLYGYQIFRNDLSTKAVGEYGLPYAANLSSIEDYLLTDNGEFFMGVLELSAIENHGVRVRKAFKNLHVYQLNEEGIKDYTFDLEGKRISNFVMNARLADRLTLFGIYSKDEWDGQQDGFFSTQIDLNKDSSTAVHFIPFSKEMMLSEFSTSEQMRVERKLERRNEDPQLSRYEVRDIFTLADGSYVGSIEKYYIYTNTNYNSQTGQRMTTNYYYYNDIVAFGIDPDGQLRWEQRIPKMQVSVNDYGPYSSYFSFVDSNQLHFIFNDSRANYNQEGFFNSKVEDLSSFSLSRQRNVGAWVQIDLQNGNQQRQIIHERSNNNLILVPKAFEWDVFQQGIYTYGVLGPQEKFGYIHLQTHP